MNDSDFKSETFQPHIRSITSSFAHYDPNSNTKVIDVVHIASILLGGLTDHADAMGCHIGSVHEPYVARRGSSIFAVNESRRLPPKGKAGLS